MSKEMVNHPSHYGGADNVYEVIKVIDAYELDFCLGNVIKYVLRAGEKDDIIQDLEKAAWYLNHKIELIKKEREESILTTTVFDTQEMPICKGEKDDNK